MTLLTSFVGVYDANGSIPAEIAYWIGARLGRRHCALCDITHSSVREKASWKACRASLPVPFETLHLDERDPALAALTDGAVPCVVARTDAGDRILLDAEALERCAGDPERLIASIEAAMADADLAWPAATATPPT